MTPSRILIARSAIEDFYEPAWARALRDNGHDVQIFDTFAHLTKDGVGDTGGAARMTSADRWGWLQHRLLWGPRVFAANRALVERTRSFRPDVVLLYLGHHFYPDTVEALGRESFVTLYHSDDPFGPRRHHPRYRVVHACWPLYGGGHLYRPATCTDAAAAGLRRAAVLLDFYRPWEDHPRGGAPEDEAAFIGHFEPDGRVACVEAAVRAGLPFRVHSREPAWQGKLAPDVAKVAGPFPGLYGDAYRQKLSRAKVSVCFLSKWNRDVYTKRVFEIPACGGFLLCERSDLMQSLYDEGREAELFSSPEELVDKLRHYLRHEAARAAIAKAGHARVVRSGHDIHSRLRAWAAEVDGWRAA